MTAAYRRRSFLRFERADRFQFASVRPPLSRQAPRRDGTSVTGARPGTVSRWLVSRPNESAEASKPLQPFDELALARVARVDGVEAVREIGSGSLLRGKLFEVNE